MWLKGTQRVSMVKGLRSEFLAGRVQLARLTKEDRSWRNHALQPSSLQ